MDGCVMPVTPEQWALYGRSVVDIRLPDRTLRVTPAPLGTADGPFPGPAGGTIHVITAWNPYGRTASSAANHRAHGLLLAEIEDRRLAWWPAVGGSPCGTHTEESVAVAGLGDTAARRLGRRFGQDAIFAWTGDTWRLLACFGDRTAEHGWTASPGPFRPEHRLARLGT